MKKNLLNRTLFPISPLPPQILQFGGGNFIRGFADWVIQEMNERLDYGAGVVVVKPTPSRRQDWLTAQNGLFTLCLTAQQDGQPLRKTQLIDCIQRQIDPYDSPEALWEMARVPSLRIVMSNTTEAGIFFDPQATLLDAPQVSFPSKLTRLLWERFQAFEGDPAMGWVVIPCELLEENGTRLLDIVLSHARQWQLPMAFEAWVRESCHFCNTLVDRIVPGYPADQAEKWREELGYEDHLLVEAEAFHLWVIQGTPEVMEAFPAHKAGLQVIFSDQLDTFRTRKVRILNGAHTCMVPVAYLAGLRTVKEAVADPAVGLWIRELLLQEIAPGLPGPQEELLAYVQDILQRFANPFLHHELISIALNASTKFRTRVIPSLLAWTDTHDSLPPRLLLALAAHLVFYSGTSSAGSIPLQDEPDRLAIFANWWRQWREGSLSTENLVTQALAHEDLWGHDLSLLPGIVELVAEKVDLIQGGHLLQCLQENKA